MVDLDLDGRAAVAVVLPLRHDLPAVGVHREVVGKVPRETEVRVVALLVGADLRLELGALAAARHGVAHRLRPGDPRRVDDLGGRGAVVVVGRVPEVGQRVRTGEVGLPDRGGHGRGVGRTGERRRGSGGRGTRGARRARAVRAGTAGAPDDHAGDQQDRHGQPQEAVDAGSGGGPHGVAPSAISGSSVRSGWFCMTACSRHLCGNSASSSPSARRVSTSMPIAPRSASAPAASVRRASV